MRILITGGAGFIGSCVVRTAVLEQDFEVLTIDALTYAGNLDNLAPVASHPRHRFMQGDITDRAAMCGALATFRPDVVMNLAAESHVDRSIDGAAAFIRTNVTGTFELLEACRAYWSELPAGDRARFRFHHISTDEVYGDLAPDEPAFTETHPSAPSSPYAASKAASDHLVRAWYRTYGLPIVLTNCSNNYGPCHFPEKLIPLIILNAIEGKPLPIYGNGEQIRDWLHVEDHARALLLVAQQGKTGRTYNIGGHNEKRNIDVVEEICEILETLKPEHPPGVERYRDLIIHVTDRPGHDLRYAIDAGRIERELGWRPRETFDSGLRKTVRWFLENPDWWGRIRSGAYRGERLGLLGEAG